MNFDRIKKVIVVYKESHKVASTFKFIQAELRKLEDAAKDVLGECAKVSAKMKSVQDECTNISSKIPDTLQKDWWCDADAVTRIVLCGGLILCMSIMSFSMRVGALKELSDMADASVKKCQEVTRRLDETVKMADDARNSIHQFHDSITNKLQNALPMISDLSNKIEQINFRLKETEGRDDTNGSD